MDNGSEKSSVIDIVTAKPKELELQPHEVKPGTVTVEFDQVKGIPENMVGPIRWDHPMAAHVKIVDAKAGIIERTRSKVCIVGYAENSRHAAWYEDPDCEIWGVNQLNRFIPRADRWFQMHTDWNDNTKWAAGTDQAKWLRECPIPVYMIEPDPVIPNSVHYPIERIMAELGTHDYFTSTIAFMVALAIAEGFKEIGIYGIDLIIGREYFFEKACVEFYLGIAHARGIEYHKPDNCALLWQACRYGYEPEPNYGFFGLGKLRARTQQLAEQVQRARDEVHVYDGKLQEAIWIRERLNPDAQAQMDKRIAELRADIDKRLNKLYLNDGACQEVSRMHEILEVKSRGGSVE